jgi:hypothetical protein
MQCLSLSLSFHVAFAIPTQGGEGLLIRSVTIDATLAGRPLLIALLSDIHANLEALEACLRHARERGAERHAFLGDFVGYGADAAESSR